MTIVGLRGVGARRFLGELWRTFLASDTLDLAAQLAFYSVLALFPFAMLVATVVALLPIPGLCGELQQVVQRFAPSVAAPLLGAAARNVVTGGSLPLLLFGVAGTLYSASGGVAALTTALNRAYGVPETRSWWRVRARSLGITLLVAVLTILLPVALLVGPGAVAWLADLLHLGRAWAVAWAWLRWPFAVALMIVLLAFLYWACPNVQRRWRLLTPGSVIAVPLWILTTLALNAYIQRLPSFNRTYGALGTGIALLLWLQLSATVIVVGGQMNAVVARLSPELPTPAPRPRGSAFPTQQPA